MKPGSLLQNDTQSKGTWCTSKAGATRCEEKSFLKEGLHEAERGKEEALNTAEGVRWRCWVSCRIFRWQSPLEGCLSGTAAPLSLASISFVPLSSAPPSARTICSILMIMSDFSWLSPWNHWEHFSWLSWSRSHVVNWNSSGKRNKIAAFSCCLFGCVGSSLQPWLYHHSQTCQWMRTCPRVAKWIFCSNTEENRAKGSSASLGSFTNTPG